MNRNKLYGIAASALVGALSYMGINESLAIDTNRVERANAPKSVFDEKLSSGKDPFYPKWQGNVPKTNAVPKIELILGGFSGEGTNRTAIVNNHTFAEGDLLNLNVGFTNRMDIYCEKIAEDYVVVQLGKNETNRVKLTLPTIYK